MYCLPSSFVELSDLDLGSFYKNNEKVRNLHNNYQVFDIKLKGKLSGSVHPNEIEWIQLSHL